MIARGAVHHHLARPALAFRTAQPTITCSALSEPASALQALANGVALTGGVAVLSVGVALALWLWWENYLLSLRSRRARPAGPKKKSVLPGQPEYVPPRDVWTEAEIAQYDGGHSEDAPILLAADGRVFNVGLARSFYGPGGEYAVMAGIDATRYLARNSVEPEPPEKAALPLNVAERAALGAWMLSLENKYDVVGRLVSDEEVADVRRRDAETSAYLDRMEELSAELEQETERGSNR